MSGIDQCPICLEKIQNKARPDSCGHLGCNQCLKTWLNNNNTCPVCREPIRYIYSSYNGIEFTVVEEIKSYEERALNEFWDTQWELIESLELPATRPNSRNSETIDHILQDLEEFQVEYPMEVNGTIVMIEM